MILIDANLLIYATLDTGVHHAPARDWLKDQMDRAPHIGLPWHSLLGFVRISSNKHLYPHGPSVDTAWSVVKAWLSVDHVWIPSPTDRHAETIGQLLSAAKIGSGDVMDIHLAALAMEHGLTLCSADKGFARYRNLRWLNPLEP